MGLDYLLNTMKKRTPAPVFTDAPGWEGGATAEHQEMCVVKVGATWHMFYAAGPRNVAVEIGHASTSEANYPLGWTRNPANPVIHNNEQAIDTIVASPNCLIQMQDGSWRLYYQGYNGSEAGGCVATTSAVNFPTGWVKDAGNPRFTKGAPGAWDGNSVRLCAVVPAWDAPDAQWHVLYAGFNGVTWRVGHAVSNDGLTWTKDANPLPEFNPSGSGYWGKWSFPFTIFRDGSTYYLMWGGMDVSNVWRSFYATSEDLVTWNVAPVPNLVGGTAPEWDHAGVNAMQLVRDPAVPGSIDLWYLGTNINNDMGFNIGVARSSGTPLVPLTFAGGAK